MQLEDYINILQGRLERFGNVDVTITQGGYYADGRFADFYEMPELKTIQTNEEYEWIDGKSQKVEPVYKEFLVLGHSHQSY